MPGDAAAAGRCRGQRRRFLDGAIAIDDRHRRRHARERCGEALGVADIEAQHRRQATAGERRLRRSEYQRRRRFGEDVRRRERLVGADRNGEDRAGGAGFHRHAVDPQPVRGAIARHLRCRLGDVVSERARQRWSRREIERQRGHVGHADVGARQVVHGRAQAKRLARL
ncbi:MAG: hypothetical protein U1E35_01105 [Rhodospirillales bacterium]